MFIEKLKDSEIKEFFAKRNLVVCNINKIYNDKGKMQNVLVFVKDITEDLICKTLNRRFNIPTFTDYSEIYLSRAIFLNDKRAIEILNIKDDKLDLTQEWKEFVKIKKDEYNNKKNSIGLNNEENELTK